MKRLELQIHGRVQGVAFRWSAQREAQALGLTGWVRNRVDGSVLLVAEGEPEVLERLLAWSKKGPAQARVDRVDFAWGEAMNECESFEVTG